MALGVPFGSYRLVRRIGRGGMAEVFQAWQLSPSLAIGVTRAGGPGRDGGAEDAGEAEGFYDHTTGIRFVRQVAVKRILPHLSESDEFRALFLQEARLAAMLSHPSVVHIYDFGRAEDSLFLAMELIEGVNLAALLRAGTLPVEHAVRIAADVLAGLHHAHTRTDSGRPLHIVHRDVSPQNVMITLDGVVKILDFGIAKAAWSAQETRPGVVRGKYAYMSPEQAEGQRLDGRSDVYAVGVCLWELLAGAPLVPRDLPLPAALRAVRGGSALETLPRLEQLRPEVPPELVDILRRALQTRREHRYESAAEMQLDLERFLKGWPSLSSSVLLSEYLRKLPLFGAGHGHGRSLGPEANGRPAAGGSGFGAGEEGQVTPVLQQAEAFGQEPAAAGAGESTMPPTAPEADPRRLRKVELDEQTLLGQDTLPRGLDLPSANATLRDHRGRETVLLQAPGAGGAGPVPLEIRASAPAREDPTRQGPSRATPPAGKVSGWQDLLRAWQAAPAFLRAHFLGPSLWFILPALLLALLILLFAARGS